MRTLDALVALRALRDAARTPVGRIARFAPIALLAAAARPSSCSSCEGRVGEEANGGEPTSACVEGEARCASTREVELCSGGRPTRQACPESALCVDGGCAALGDLASRPAELFSLGRSGAGFIDAWASSGPLAATQARRFEEAPADPGALGDASAWRPLCARGGQVAPRLDERPGGQVAERGDEARFLLAGELLVGRARRVRLQAGVRGRLRVYLGGALALDARGDPARPLLVDGAIASADLPAGRVPVVVLLEGKDGRAPSFTLRVRGERGEAPELRFAPGRAQGKPCSAADLAEARTELFPVRGGFVARIEAGLPGLVPSPAPSPRESKLVLRIARARPGEPATPLADLPFPLAEPASIPVLPLAPGAHALALSLVEAGAGADPAPPFETRPFRYAGDLHERIAALSEARLKALAAPLPEGSRESFVHRVETLLTALARGERDRRWLERETKEAEALLAAFADGADPYAEKTGVVERAYRSPIDGALQPYVAFVPPSYARQKDRRYPLVVVFHGRDRLPEHALRTVFGRAPEPGDDLERMARHLPSFPDLGAIVVAPSGFGNQAHRLMGEEDILRVVLEMKKAYRVDERRVSITGYSLGGTVAFHLPLHFPHIFSAAAPLCGYPNLLGYESVRRFRRQPFEDVVLARRNIANYAENGLHVPLHIVHGGKDGPERSEVVAARYRALGQPAIFDVQEDLGHDVWSYAYEGGKMIAWLRDKRAPELPARVRLRTGEYRYGRAYWVRLVGMISSEAFAEIDATRDEASGRVSVSTKNVEAFSIDAGALSAASDGGAGETSLEVRVDGRTIRVPGGRAEAFFARREDGFVLEGHEPSRAGKKRKGVSGPLDDVYRHPAAVIYGSLDPARAEMNRLVAEHHAAFDAFSGGRLPVLADDAIADAHLRGRSLVLVGGPAENRVTALAMAAKNGLPLRFFPGGLELRGRRFEGENVGVSLVYPSPFDEREYVVLHAGVGARGALLSRNLPALAPDFLVYDERLTPSPGALLLEARPVLDGGFFDESWR